MPANPGRTDGVGTLRKVSIGPLKDAYQYYDGEQFGDLTYHKALSTDGEVEIYGLDLTNLIITGYVAIQSGTPELVLNETDATANNRLWGILAQSEQLHVRAINDAVTLSETAIKIDRTAQVIDTVTIGTASEVVADCVNDRVGFFTASPAAKVHVYSDAYNSFRVQRSTPGGGCNMQFIDGDGKYAEFTQSTGHFYISGATGGNVYFREAAANRLTISATSGTVTVANQLTVSGTGLNYFYGKNRIFGSGSYCTYGEVISGWYGFETPVNAYVLSTGHQVLRTGTTDKHIYFDCSGIFYFRDQDASGADRVQIDSATGDLTTIGHINIDEDNKRIYFGQSQDASIHWDGSNLIYSPALLGSGKNYLYGVSYFSGNVGIGFTSPNCPLETLGRVRITSNTVPSSSTGGAVEIGYYSAGSTGVIMAYNRTTPAYNELFYDASQHKFAISGTTKATFTSAGDLNLVGLLDVDGAGLSTIAGSLTVTSTLTGTGAVIATTRLRTKFSTASTSTPPTEAQLNSAFYTPSSSDWGCIAVLDRGGSGVDVYLCVTATDGSSGFDWFYVKLTKAT